MQRKSTIWNSEDDLVTLFTTTVTLSPSQQKVANQLLAAAASGKVCLLKASSGMGKTTILRWLHARLGGVFVAARKWVSAQSGPILLVDDLHLVNKSAFPERGLVYATANELRGRAATHAIDKFKPQDYAVICSRYLGEAAERLDMAGIHRAAPDLNAHQLKYASLRLGLRYEAPTTAGFLDEAYAQTS